MLKQINGSHLHRIWGLPKNVRKICMLARLEELNRIQHFLEENPHAELCMVVVLNASSDIVQRIKISGPASNGIKVTTPSDLADCPDLEKVFICPDSPVTAAAFMTEVGRFCASLGISTFYFNSTVTPAHTIRQPFTDYLKKCGGKLAKAYTLWSDAKSRETFSGRVKAILTGNSGYIPMSSHMEYFHPIVHPAPGDIMIDGGISDMVGSQKAFLEAVGPSGHVFGFEPIPGLAESADRQLVEFSAWTLTCAGLAQTPGNAFFEDLRDSSHISQNQQNPGSGKVECRLESIDNFCAQNHINRVNVIKLDVEGAELSALKGAERVIREFRPALIVCLYHKPEDMFEIPLYLSELVRNYKFYLAHSSCQFMDTILYARPE